MNDFAWYLTSFFSQYLPGEKNMSVNTIASYRDTFRVFFLFCEKVKSISINKITLSLFTKEFIIEFLDWLETEETNGSIAFMALFGIFNRDPLKTSLNSLVSSLLLQRGLQRPLFPTLLNWNWKSFFCNQTSRPNKAGEIWFC